MTKAAALLAVCVLARPKAGACAWCSAQLPPRRRSWCGERCASTFWKNHWWSLARRAAKRRDKYACVRCSHAPPKRPARADRPAYRAWRAARKTDRLEVNHINPCLGAHDTLSCAHHLDNLETLCVACHRVHTSGLTRTGDFATMFKTISNP